MNNFPKRVECLIVGGSIAGLFLGRQLAKQNVEVLVIEQRPAVGLPRAGEAIPASVFEKFLSDYSSVIRGRIRNVVFINSRGEELRRKGEKVKGYVLQRAELERRLGEDMLDEGGELIVNRRVSIFDPEKKIVRIGDYLTRAEIVIGADGVYSTVAKSVGVTYAGILVPGQERTICSFQAQWESDTIYLDFLEESRWGYAWLFPKGEKTANIGIMGNSKQSLWKLFEKSRVQQKIGGFYSVLEDKGGIIPLSPPPDRIAGNNWALVGDAARQIHPIHGGGIFIALPCIQALAKAIVEHPEDWSTTYEEWWKNNLKPLQEYWYQIAQWFYTLPAEKRDLLWQILTPDEFWKLLEGEIPREKFEEIANEVERTN